MTTKHTPGPWDIREGFRSDTWEVFPTRGAPPDDGFSAWAELATVVADYNDDDMSEGEANARLIAAAPELLAALQALDLLIDFNDDEIGTVWMFDDISEMRAAIELANLAIAKATGNVGS